MMENGFLLSFAMVRNRDPRNENEFAIGELEAMRIESQLERITSESAE